MFVLSACSSTFQSNDAVFPQVNVPITQMGHNKKIFVVVEDGRADDTIGRTGDGVNITIDKDDLLNNIKNQVYNALLNNKFELTSDDQAIATKLTVRIVGIQYRQMSMAQKLSENHALATVVLEAVVTSKGKTFKKDYRTDNDDYYMAPLFINDIQKINETVANTIEKLFIDKELVAFMANN